MSKYTAIFKLKNMLTEAGIPFEFIDRKDMSSWGKEWWQITYPVNRPLAFQVCSVIQGWGTYGQEADLLEIMGLLTEEEKEHTVSAGT